MSEVSYAPLSAACVRALTDKMYDKRKAAALEIEKWEIQVQFNLCDFVTQNLYFFHLD